MYRKLTPLPLHSVSECLWYVINPFPDLSVHFESCISLRMCPNTTFGIHGFCPQGRRCTRSKFPHLTLQILCYPYSKSAYEDNVMERGQDSLNTKSLLSALQQRTHRDHRHLVPTTSCTTPAYIVYNMKLFHLALLALVLCGISFFSKVTAEPTVMPLFAPFSGSPLPILVLSIIGLVAMIANIV